MTAKEGDTKVYTMLGTVNQDPDADDYAALAFYRRHNFADGAAGGKEVINNENALTLINAEASFKSPLFLFGLFGKYTSYS